MTKDNKKRNFEEFVQENVDIKFSINEFHLQNLEQKLLKKYDLVKSKKKNLLFNIFKMKNWKIKLASFSTISAVIAGVIIFNSFDFKKGETRKASAQEVLERSIDNLEKAEETGNVFYVKSEYKNSNDTKTIAEYWYGKDGQSKVDVYMVGSSSIWKRVIKKEESGTRFWGKYVTEDNNKNFEFSFLDDILVRNEIENLKLKNNSALVEQKNKSFQLIEKISNVLDKKPEDVSNEVFQNFSTFLPEESQSLLNCYAHKPNACLNIDISAEEEGRFLNRIFKYIENRYPNELLKVKDDYETLAGYYVDSIEKAFNFYGFLEVVDKMQHPSGSTDFKLFFDTLIESDLANNVQEAHDNDLKDEFYILDVSFSDASSWLINNSKSYKMKIYISKKDYSLRKIQMFEYDNLYGPGSGLENYMEQFVTTKYIDEPNFGNALSEDIEKYNLEPAPHLEESL